MTDELNKDNSVQKYQPDPYANVRRITGGRYTPPSENLNRVRQITYEQHRVNLADRARRANQENPARHKRTVSLPIPPPLKPLEKSQPNKPGRRYWDALFDSLPKLEKTLEEKSRDPLESFQALDLFVELNDIADPKNPHWDCWSTRDAFSDYTGIGLTKIEAIANWLQYYQDDL